MDLPGFDEYLLGYSERHAPLSGADTDTDTDTEVIVSGGNGMFLSTIVVNGEVVGSWRRPAKAKKITLTTAPFGELSTTAHKAVVHSATRYGEYLGLPVELDGP